MYKTLKSTELARFFFLAICYRGLYLLFYKGLSTMIDFMIYDDT